jgi:hypothetical protein
MPDDDIHGTLAISRNSQPTAIHQNQGRSKADQLTKEADEADAKYKQTKSETDKNMHNKQLTAANYLMFEANLSPKKYKPALQRYNRVLELDPQNVEAMENKNKLKIFINQWVCHPN